MPRSERPTRRRFMLLSTAGVGAALAPGQALGLGDKTPRQVDGPYYPTRLEMDAAGRDNDLVHVAGSATPAGGTVILVTGKVLDRGGRPKAGASVELWQAGSAGRYLSGRDHRRERERDPGFQYFGTCETDRAGLYAFRTIVPPSYPAGLGNWIRPRHLHFRVRGIGRRDFITQMYFDDPADPSNEEENLALHRRDALLKTVPVSKRPLLVRPVQAFPSAGLDARLGVTESLEAPWQGLSAPKWVHFPLVLDGELRQE